MLTNAAVKAALPAARSYKLWDGGGLHLFVAPSGTKSWRLKLRLDGREQLLTLGRAPDMTLAAARLERDRRKAALAGTASSARKTPNKTRIAMNPSKNKVNA